MTKTLSPRNGDRGLNKQSLTAPGSASHRASSLPSLSNSTFGSSNSSLLSMLPFEIQECSDEDDSEASFTEDDISTPAAFWQESSSSLRFNVDHTPSMAARRDSSDSDQFDKCLQAMQAQDMSSHDEEDDESEVEWDGCVEYNDESENGDDSSIDLSHIVHEMEKHQGLAPPQRALSPSPDHRNNKEILPKSNACPNNHTDTTEDTLSVSETEFEEHHMGASYVIKRRASLEDVLLDKRLALPARKMDAAPCKARRRMSNPSLVSLMKQSDDPRLEAPEETVLRRQAFPSIPKKKKAGEEDEAEDLAPSIARRKPSMASLAQKLHDSSSTIRSHKSNASWRSTGLGSPLRSNGKGENPFLAKLD